MRERMGIAHVVLALKDADAVLQNLLGDWLQLTFGFQQFDIAPYPTV